MKKKENNTRLIVLSVLAVLSFGFYMAVASPLSPLANICEDVDDAKQQYANKDISKRNKFIAERNKHCKILLSERKNTKGIYNQLENCSIIDYAVDASDRYIALKKDKNPGAVRSDAQFFLENLDSYSYCPQYGEVTTKYKKLAEAYKRK